MRGLGSGVALVGVEQCRCGVTLLSGAGLLGLGGRDAVWRRGQERACERGQLAAGAGVIAGEGFSTAGGRELCGAGEVEEQEFGESVQSEGVVAPCGVEEPVGEGEERVEGRWRVEPEEGEGAGEVARIGEQIPEPGKAPEPLHGWEVQEPVGQQVVGWIWIVDHAVLGVVSCERGAAEALEDADLNFLRAEAHESIEAGGQALERFAGEADDEVGMEMGGGLGAEEAEVLRGACDVLATMDAVGDVRVEGLDTDFELQASGGEAGDEIAEFGREEVGDHLEVEEEVGAQPVEEELEDRAGGGCVQVEGAVYELESEQPAIEQLLELVEEGREREPAHRRVEGGEAELAGKRAAAGGFDVHDPVCDVGLGVERVGQGEGGEVGCGGGDDFPRRRHVAEEVQAEVGECKVSFPGDDVVGQIHDFLSEGFMADFGAAEDDEGLGADAFEEGDHVARGAGVPDVDAEANDAGVVAEDGFDDVEGALVDVELDEDSARLEGSQIGEEIAEAECGVNELGVEGGQENVRHTGMGRYQRKVGMAKAIGDGATGDDLTQGGRE